MWRHRLIPLRVSRVIALLSMLLLCFSLPSPGQTPAERFDYVVREDFFAGFAGDIARLDRAMQTCEAILAANPQHAEAMVWHGTGLILRAGQAFGRGDASAAQPLLARGLEEMDSAVPIAPDDVGVLIPRAATLSTLAGVSALHAQARPWRETAAADYEKVLALQAPHFAALSVHARGELLAGLAENHDRLGNTVRARHFLERIVRELPGSPYAAVARAWLGADPAAPRGRLSCLGCHTR